MGYYNCNPYDLTFNSSKAFKMKKIILALMMMVSVSFANYISISTVNPVVGKCYYENGYYFVLSSSFTAPKTSCSDAPEANSLYFTTMPYGSSTFSASFVSRSSCYSSAGSLCCSTSFATINSSLNKSSLPECVNFNPTCVSGGHFDTETNTCQPDIEIESIENIVSSSGSTAVVKYADGAEMLINPDGSGITFAADGSIIPNRYAINGILPTDSSIDNNSFSFDSSAEIIHYNSLKADGNSWFSFNGAGQIALNAASLFVGATAGSWIWALTGDYVTKSNVEAEITPMSSTSAVMNVTLVDSSDVKVDLAAVENSATATPTTIPNTNLQAEKLTTDDQVKQFNDSWAGDGPLGATVIFPTSNSNSAALSTPDYFSVFKKNPDGSITSVKINKADLVNVAKNNTDLLLSMEQQDYILNNDGTKTTTKKSTAATVSPTTNTNTKTDGATGQTTTQKPTATTSKDSNGVSTDLSALTGRMETMGNQLTKLNTGVEGLGKGMDKANGLLKEGNDLANTANGLLSGIQNNTASSKNSLNGIEGAVNAIKGLLSDGEVSTTPNNIPSDTTGSDWNSWSSTWNNIESSFDDVALQVTQFQGLFQNGFELKLVSNSIKQCPYNGSLDFGFGAIPITFDFCDVLSPFRNITYTMFYLYFVFLILSFSIKTFIRMI